MSKFRYDPCWVTVNDHNKYYVYAYYDKTGYPFYIGKGKGFRVNCHMKPSSRREHSYKNHKIASLLKSQGYVRREIIAYTATEDEAYELEEFLISSYGLKNAGGVLTNVVKSRYDIPPSVSSKQSRKSAAKKQVKYSEREALEMIDLYYQKIFNQKELGEIYGVSSSCVGALLCGNTKMYKHLNKKHNPKVTRIYDEYEILHMVLLRNSGVPVKEVMTRYSVSKTQFYRLINRYTAGAGTSTDPTNISTGDGNLENTA